MKNKKGVLGETMTAIVAAVVIILILAVFLIAFKFLTFSFIKGGPEKISLQEQGIVTLESYLRSTASVDGKNISMADLIRASAADAEYKEQLSKSTAEFFSGYKNFNLDIPSISFSYPDVSPVIGQEYAVQFSSYKTSVKMTIPAKENIEVWFYQE